MAICENCGTSFTPSETRTEVTSLRILCEKCEAERKAEKARRAAEKAAAAAGGSNAKAAPPVPTTRRATPAPVSTNSAATTNSTAPANSKPSAPANAKPSPAPAPASRITSAESAPRVSRPAPPPSRPAPAASRPAPAPSRPAMEEEPDEEAPRAAPARTSRGAKGKAAHSGAPDVRREIELLKKRENKVMMIGWMVCGGLLLIALGVWWRVQAQKTAEADARAAAIKEVEDFVVKMKSFDVANLVQANEAIALAESKKVLWEEGTASSDVGSIVSRAKTNIETAKEKKETEDRLANAEQVIQNAANETPQNIAKIRRILSDLEQRVDVMGDDFKARVTSAKSVIDKTYATRLRDEAKALLAKGPTEARAALTAYTAAEDEVLKLFEDAIRRKNKEAEAYYKAQYQEIITESDTLVASIFTPEYIEKVTWRDLLAGDATKAWANDGLKGFRFDGGTLHAVGPELGAGKTAIMSIGDREQWRDFELDIEATIVAGSAQLYFRLGKRTDTAGEMYSVVPGESGFKLGEKFNARATFIGSKFSLTWEDAGIQPYSNEARWANTRKGAFGITLNEGSEIKISKLRIRELR